METERECKFDFGTYSWVRGELSLKTEGIIIIIIFPDKPSSYFITWNIVSFIDRVVSY